MGPDRPVMVTAKYYPSFFKGVFPKRFFVPILISQYRGADKSLARPGRKQATATKDSSFIYPIYNHNLRNIKRGKGVP